jgi:hypothetical protein
VVVTAAEGFVIQDIELSRCERLKTSGADETGLVIFAR